MNKGIAIGGEFKKPTWLISFILIATFLFVDKFTEKSSWSIVKYIAEDWSVMNRVGILAIVHWGLPYIAVPMIVTAFLFGKNTVFDKLGLNRSVIKGLGFAFAVTLPLPLVYGFTTPISQTGELIPDILHYAIFAGTAEEILFRCFLFGLLSNSSLGIFTRSFVRRSDFRFWTYISRQLHLRVGGRIFYNFCRRALVGLALRGMEL